MGVWALGDIHGDWSLLKRSIAEIVKQDKDASVIQVGDLGYWPKWSDMVNEWNRHKPYLNSGISHLCCIDGNHDDPRNWPKRGKVGDGIGYEIGGHWLHLHGRGTFAEGGNLTLPRGYKRCLFLGGAKSVDRNSRVQGGDRHGWFTEEQISEADEDVAKGLPRDAVDLMITHTPPDSFVRAHFGLKGLRQFGINPKTWVDESALAVERVWEYYGCPELVCGHMHQSISDGNIRVLNIGEFIRLDRE